MVMYKIDRKGGGWAKNHSLGRAINNYSLGNYLVNKKKNGIFLENDFWTLPPSYQFCTWILQKVSQHNLTRG